MIEFFTSPILRAPTIGSMLMCFAAGLIGCLAFLQKRSLIGEALSHAAYPGIVISIFFTSTIATLIGAFLSAFLGLFVIDRLEKKLRVSSDAALCFVLSIFFGVGVLIASRLQVTHALWFKQIQIFLFGQVATMVDHHIYLYGALSLAVLTVVIVFFRFLEILNFDENFAKSVGMKVTSIQFFTYFLLVLAIVVGMRSVGVVLMSAMLIAPAAAARQWTHHLGSFFGLSAIFGMISGFFGNALSVWIGKGGLSLPTGPMIVLCAASICFFSLLFAPEKGIVFRIIRIRRFRFRCKQENLLKALYKNLPYKKSSLVFWRMKMKGWLSDSRLTDLGRKEAEKLIRLHRLWEVYLVHMGQRSDRVHYSAEEMEHILTPEIEKELKLLLNDPQKDPHAQPIPQETL